MNFKCLLCEESFDSIWKTTVDKMPNCPKCDMSTVVIFTGGNKVER